MKILLVDSDPVYLNLLAEILTLHSHSVVTATDGPSALAVLHRDPVDLVIADAATPGTNGTKLRVSLRTDPAMKRIPFAWNASNREIQRMLEVRDPALDFTFDKATPLPSVLSFVDRVMATRQAQERVENIRALVRKLSSDQRPPRGNGPTGSPDIINNHE